MKKKVTYTEDNTPIYLVTKSRLTDTALILFENLMKKKVTYTENKTHAWNLSTCS